LKLSDSTESDEGIADYYEEVLGRRWLLSKRKIGKQLISFVEKHAQARGYTEVELNVNRRNPAYYFYLKSGFKVHQEINIPYHAYVLDDYIMRKTISLQN